MRETEPLLLVAGCGEKGAEWISRRNKAVLILGLDREIPKGVVEDTSAPFILGDVFNLPIKSGTINQIYGDFIVNGLTSRDIAATQILENPEVLDTDYFPSLVRQWFVQSLNRSHDSVRRNIKEVSTLLKTVALREMWRVLANNGRLQLLDFEYNINWIAHYAPQIVNENPDLITIQPLHISNDDYDRSSSLKKVERGSTYVQKLSLTKNYPTV